MKWVKVSKIVLVLIIVLGFISLGVLYRRSIAVESGPWIQKSGVRSASVPPSPLQADAGDDFIVFSKDLKSTVIYGYANGTDNDRLFYRWREKNVVLTSWQKVGLNGQVILDFSEIAPLHPGKHILTLEVHDGKNTASDQVVLTVAASPKGVAS